MCTVLEEQKLLQTWNLEDIYLETQIIFLLPVPSALWRSKYSVNDVFKLSSENEKKWVVSVISGEIQRSEKKTER